MIRSGGYLCEGHWGWFLDPGAPCGGLRNLMGDQLRRVEEWFPSINRGEPRASELC
jgi:hypothetical protein